MLRRKTRVGVLVLLLASGCQGVPLVGGGTPFMTDSSASAESGVDIDVPTGFDVPPDAGPAPDDVPAAVDSGADVAPDLGMDVGIDAGSDVGTDAGTDLGFDVGTDAGTVTGPDFDAVFDTGVVTAIDVPVVTEGPGRVEASVADSAAVDEIANTPVDVPMTTSDGGCGATPSAVYLPTVSTCIDRTACVYSSCDVVPMSLRNETSNSGVYHIDPDGAGPVAQYDAYCHFVSNKGWTLALKVDGRQSVFTHDSPLWTSATLHNGTSLDLSLNDARLAPSVHQPFQELRMVMLLGNSEIFKFGSPNEPTATSIPFGVTFATLHPVGTGAPSLRALFSHCATTPLTPSSRTAWMSLLPSFAQMQSGGCERGGFNVAGDPDGQGRYHGRARLGFVANQEVNECSPDSRIGIGLDRQIEDACGDSRTNAIVAGNVSWCANNPTSGIDSDIAAFVYVFVR